MASKQFLAIDLGASSGRHVVGRLAGEKLSLQETHRFENIPVRVADSLHWNFLELWREVQNGITASVAAEGEIASLGIDTWGVDFGLLGRHDVLLGNPYHYRDKRTEGAFQWAFESVSKEQVFEETGLQFMPINTLYQLLAMQRQNSPLLEQAEHLLMIPDLFHWLLTGEKVNEQTDASTTQLYNPRQGDWSHTLIEKFALPKAIFGTLAAPGTNLGKLRPTVAAETNAPRLEVVLPGSHDTASAVAAVPAASASGSDAEKPDWCYISSGTWSLVGVESQVPVINKQALNFNFTNEAGIGRTTRLLKNVAGLWLVQECRRIWQNEGHEYTWESLNQLAAAAAPLVSIVNPDDPRLAAPEDMPETIRTLCRESGQTIPKSEGAVLRCALESLALKYCLVITWLEQLMESPIRTVHIVGGGSQNRLLCQMTADACNRQVIAGPVEATAIGNIMMQAIAAGEIGSLAEARTLVRKSFEVDHYFPQNPDRWDSLLDKFLQLEHMQR